MSDRLVTIASFASTLEAQMAKNLLETEGIPALVGGELIAEAFSGGAGEAQLQVRAQDAPRAVSLLADVAAKASLDDDWETQAERGLWTCPLCGTASPVGATACPACGTANSGIRTDPRETRINLETVQRVEDQVKKGDQIQEARPWSPLLDAEVMDQVTAPKGAAGCVVLLLVLPWLCLLWLV
jgi:hypothetical protein